MSALELVTSQLQVSLGGFKAQTQLCCVCVKINHCNRESNIMMGTQRAFLSPASSLANNGLHKYEHINTQGGAQVSTDQITPDRAHKLSLCTLSKSEWCEGRGQEERRSPDTRCGDWSLVMLRSYEDVITAASRQVYTCTVGPWGDQAGAKCEIFTRDPV